MIVYVTTGALPDLTDVRIAGRVRGAAARVFARALGTVHTDRGLGLALRADRATAPLAQHEARPVGMTVAEPPRGVQRVLDTTCVRPRRR